MTLPCPAPFNLADHVLSAAPRDPEKIALAVLGPARAERWSYARLTRAVRGMAGALGPHGLPGDRVLLRLGNTVDFPVAFLGAVAADLVPVPTAAGLTEGEITRLARFVAPAAILAAPDIALPDLPGVPVLTELAAMMEHAPGDIVPGDPDRLAYLVFTSGSSGEPKAVAHAHRAVWARRMMVEGWYGLTPEDRLLHAGAFNWTFTLGTGLLDPWAMGATALIPAPGVPVEALPLLLRRHDATILAAAPGVFRRLLRSDGEIALPRLRHGLSAGEKLPEPLRAQWTGVTGTALHEALGHVGMLHVPVGRPRPPRARGHAGLRAGGPAARRSGRGRRGIARRRHRHARRASQRSGPDAGLLARTARPSCRSPATGSRPATACRAGPMAPSSTMAAATT
jgi:acyl-coenzyme A synthetase/AMP-(fatty) acid ligase